MTEGVKFDDGKAETLYMYLEPYYQLSRTAPAYFQVIEDLIKSLTRHELVVAKNWLKHIQDLICLTHYDADLNKMIGEVSAVSKFGAERYGIFNYQKGLKYSRVVNALLRHAFAIDSGELVAEDSQLRHAAHMAANVYLLMYQVVYHPELNDLVGLDTPSERVKLKETIVDLNSIDNSPVFTG